MNSLSELNLQFERQMSSRLLDVLIKASLIGVLVYLCYQVFSPFLNLMTWSIILAVTLYPLHQRVARMVGGKQWLASVIMVAIAAVLIVGPTLLLANSLADSVRGFVDSVRNNTLVVPAPPEGIQHVPVVGKDVFEGWTRAHADLPGFIQSMQPKIGDVARRMVGAVVNIGGGLLLFFVSFIVAAVIMAYGESGGRAAHAIFTRVSGPVRGEKLTNLSVATIRAVALGVLGVALIQAILVGLSLIIAGVPAPGILSIITLVLAIAQVPAVIVTIPAIIYIWASGEYSSGAAVGYTALLLVAGMVDNALKPLMLGRGVDVPMPVVLFGALGGLATGGILGLFVGATLLALGYQIFMNWVHAGPEAVDGADGNSVVSDGEGVSTVSV